MPVGFRCLLAWLFLAPLAGGAGVPQVTLGLVVPPTEPDADSLLHGAQLAVAEANETGDAPVRLEVRSENGQWGTVGNDAVVLVCNRHVDAIITPSDGAASHLILQVSGRTRVPVASLCSDSSVTEAGVPWVVRVVPRTIRKPKPSSPRHGDRTDPHSIGGRSFRRDARDVRPAATLNRLPA